MNPKYYACDELPHDLQDGRLIEMPNSAWFRQNKAALAVADWKVADLQPGDFVVTKEKSYSVPTYNVCVYKYVLLPGERDCDLTCTLPKNAKIIAVGRVTPKASMTVWAEVNPFVKEQELRKLLLVLTGSMHQDLFNYNHLQTIMEPPFVWHFYLDDQRYPV